MSEFLKSSSTPFAIDKYSLLYMVHNKHTSNIQDKMLSIQLLQKSFNTRWLREVRVVVLKLLKKREGGGE